MQSSIICARWSTTRKRNSPEPLRDASRATKAERQVRLFSTGTWALLSLSASPSLTLRVTQLLGMSFSGVVQECSWYSTGGRDFASSSCRYSQEEHPKLTEIIQIVPFPTLLVLLAVGQDSSSLKYWSRLTCADFFCTIKPNFLHILQYLAISCAKTSMTKKAALIYARGLVHTLTTMCPQVVGESLWTKPVEAFRNLQLLLMALAHQNRTIAIASDLRVDGAKSPEIPQREGVLGYRQTLTDRHWQTDTDRQTREG